MKWLFLGLAGFIAIESAKAYMAVGSDMMGTMGRMAALLVFLMVQAFELHPIMLTGGHGGVMPQLSKAISGRQSNMNPADPDVLLDASMWATAAYAVDFVAGINVWPIMNTSGDMSVWSLIGVGGVTMNDLAWGNLMMVFACVFLLQWCMAQYLKRGGKIPKSFTGGANA